MNLRFTDKGVIVVLSASDVGYMQQHTVLNGTIVSQNGDSIRLYLAIGETDDHIEQIFQTVVAKETTHSVEGEV